MAFSRSDVRGAVCNLESSRCWPESVCDHKIERPSVAGRAIEERQRGCGVAGADGLDFPRLKSRGEEFRDSRMRLDHERAPSREHLRRLGGGTIDGASVTANAPASAATGTASQIQWSSDIDRTRAATVIVKPDRVRTTADETANSTF